MNRKLVSIVIISLTAIAASTFSACTPIAKNELVEVLPNETAFKVDMMSGGKLQAKMDSASLMKAEKVSTGRFLVEHEIIDLCQNCSAQHEYTEVPRYKIIKISRSPVTREWTSTAATGTSAKNQSFHVESNESIDFMIGANVTAYVSEASAEKFLYHYGGKQLEDIIDGDIRGYISSFLSEQFGKNTLDWGRLNKVNVFNAAFKATEEHFKEYGIVIVRLGYTEGMTYTDPNIQKAINSRFEAEQGVEVARKTVEAAELSVKAGESLKQQRAYELEKFKAETERMKVQKWNGVNSHTVVESGGHTTANVNVE